VTEGDHHGAAARVRAELKKGLPELDPVHFDADCDLTAGSSPWHGPTPPNRTLGHCSSVRG
jgi:hypothetical protein